MLQGPWLLGFAPTSAWSAINALLCTSAFWGVFFFFFREGAAEVVRTEPVLCASSSLSGTSPTVRPGDLLSRSQNQSPAVDILDRVPKQKHVRKVP